MPLRRHFPVPTPLRLSKVVCQRLKSQCFHPLSSSARVSELLAFSVEPVFIRVFDRAIVPIVFNGVLDEFRRLSGDGDRKQESRRFFGPQCSALPAASFRAGWCIFNTCLFSTFRYYVPPGSNAYRQYGRIDTTAKNTFAFLIYTVSYGSRAKGLSYYEI